MDPPEPDDTDVPRNWFWPKPRPPVDACAQAKCDYCGRFGPLGQCQGCGAPNRPQMAFGGVIESHRQLSDGQVKRLRDLWGSGVLSTREVREQLIEVTAMGDRKAVYEEVPRFPPNRILRY